jgi:adiponectin receptor
MASRSENNSPNHENQNENDKSDGNGVLRQRKTISPSHSRRSSAPNLKFLQEQQTSTNSNNRSSRPSYVIPKKEQIRSRKLSGPRTKAPRALSPINYKVKEYLARADEKIEDYLERIVQNVDSAQFMVKSCVQKLRDWKACHFDKLPAFLRDNNYLHFGHRPELGNFAACFNSIFRIHTETGNIWTHLIGFIAMVIVTIVFYVKPLCDDCHTDIAASDKLIFLTFFIGAILCLACSTLFHTVCCHSKDISTIFSRLDYAGIALLIVGSTIPWLYYGFYCEFYTKLTYIIAISVLGILTLLLLTLEKFDRPEYRTFRALVFVGLGLVSALPIIHFLIMNGVSESIRQGSLVKLVTMGGLYLTGAFLYAARIPERWLPGKCDIWFQSHQLFHVLVVAAAFVHYHGISEMAMRRLKDLGPQCPTLSVTLDSENLVNIV